MPLSLVTKYTPFTVQVLSRVCFLLPYVAYELCQREPRQIVLHCWSKEKTSDVYC